MSIVDAVSALRVSSREPARRVVLCPVVDDEASVDAVRWALRHLVRDGDALHILHVLPNRARDAFEYAYAPPSSAFAASPVPGTRDDDDAVAARRRLDRARARRFVRERFGDVLRGTPYLLAVTTGGRGHVAIRELSCAVAEFDSMSRLDAWKTMVLLKAKKRIEAKATSDAKKRCELLVRRFPGHARTIVTALKPKSNQKTWIASTNSKYCPMIGKDHATYMQFAIEKGKSGRTFIHQECECTRSRAGKMRLTKDLVSDESLKNALFRSQNK